MEGTRICTPSNPSIGYLSYSQSPNSRVVNPSHLNYTHFPVTRLGVLSLLKMITLHTSTTHTSHNSNYNYITYYSPNNGCYNIHIGTPNLQDHPKLTKDQRWINPTPKIRFGQRPLHSHVNNPLYDQETIPKYNTQTSS